MIIPEAAPPLIGTIALCLSGGGYRAAAYHLGALKTLHELGLLDQVKYISTASGGTITAMKYVTDMIKGRTFQEFFDDMFAFLLKVNVVKEAFEMLEHIPCPTPGKDDLSLIRSAAQVYRRDLLHPRENENGMTEWTLGHLEEAVFDKAVFHDLIFNSSEFRTGNGFRFRVTLDEDLVFGNQNTKVKKEVWRQLSLADVVAATSCFPGVFEPIRFPQDFYMHNRSDAADPFENKDPKLTTVALMDGGVLDNQGLHGMTVSYKTEPLPFDLLLVSDTAAKEDDILKFEVEERKGGVTVGLFVAGFGAFLVLLLSASISTVLNFVRDFGPSWTGVLGIFVGAVAGLASIGILGLLGWGLYKLHSLPVMGAKFPIWAYLRPLKVSDIRALALGRLFSVKAMTFQVFMKRIRALQYGQTMSAIARNTRKNLFNGRTAFANIYKMVSKVAPTEDEKPLAIPELAPTSRMRKIAEKAEKVETKLWLDASEMEYLLDCGRTTMCLGLLEYLWKAKRFQKLPKPNATASPFHFVYQRWMEIKQEFRDPT